MIIQKRHLDKINYLEKQTVNISMKYGGSGIGI
jgi:hypothetical protein